MTTINYRFEVYDAQGDDGEHASTRTEAWRAAMQRSRREHRAILIHDRMAHRGHPCTWEIPADAESIYDARVVAVKE